MSFQNSIVLFLHIKQAEAIDPSLLVTRIQFPASRPRCLRIVHQPKKEFLRLLLDICKMAVQYPGGQQVIIQYPMLLLQIGSPPLAVNADVTFLFGR